MGKQSATATEDRWIMAGEACQLLGGRLRYQQLKELARRGAIGTQNLVGCRMRYDRADVERLARESVTPAAR